MPGRKSGTVSSGTDWIQRITRLADERYIKLSHGRDFMDAAVDRGCFLGKAGQEQTNIDKGGRKVKHDATIKTVTEVGLAVDEKLRILKHVIEPEHRTGKEKRICVVTGTHGDELEGQYVCYELNRILKEQKEHLKGIVEIYPALNPLAWTPYPRGNS